MADNGPAVTPNAKNNGGRRCKLTKEVQEVVCNAIRAGNTFGSSAAYAGISESTFYAWLDKGRQSLEPKHRRTKFTEFLEEVTRAKAAAEVSLVAHINQAGEKDWRAHAFLLERRNPADWGRHDHLRADVNESGTVKKVIIIRRLNESEGPVDDDVGGEGDVGGGAGKE